MYERFINFVGFIEKNDKRVLLFILLFGAMLRLGCLFSVGNSVDYSRPNYMDDINYLELSRSLIIHKDFSCWSEGFFTQSTRSPVYPALLSVFVKFFGSFGWAVLNIFLDCINILLMFVLGCLLRDRLAGLFCSFFYGVLGTSFSYVSLKSPELLSVNLFLSLLVSFWYFKNVIVRLLVSVFLLGILIHARPAFMLMIPIFAVAFYYTSSEKMIKQTLCFTLLGLLTLLPWGVRNAKVHGGFVPVCSVAGWHLFSSASSSEELSIDRLTDYVYAKERKGFTESDYFHDSLGKSREVALKSPFKVFGLGAARIFYRWGFDEPWLRFFLPKAYVVPVKIFGITLYLPDFEGYFYLFIIFLVYRFARYKKEAFSHFGKKEKLLWAVIGWYCLVHCLSIPMIQYRFVLEPLLILVFFLTLYKGEKTVESPSIAKLSLFCPLIFVVYLLFYSFIYGKNLDIKASSEDGYSVLRNEQWVDLGKLEKREVLLTGVVRHKAKGYYFEEDTNQAVIAEGCIFKLYIKENEEGTPRGLGDIKVNYSGDLLFEEGQRVIVRGRCKVGMYKDIIIDAEEVREFK